MKIVSVKIENFRSIKQLDFFPKKENVFIGPNNIGKTAIVEAINLALNPEFSSRQNAIDENDFYLRQYKVQKTSTTFTPPPGLPPAPPQPIEYSYPNIKVELVLSPVPTSTDEMDLRKYLVAWDDSQKTLHTEFDEGVNPFTDGRERAVWICFQAAYDPVEDEFAWTTYFKTKKEDNWTPDPEREVVLPYVSREMKRKIGFLIYRDIRALQRPVSLESQGLLSRIAHSQEALPKNFEEVFEKTENSLRCLSEGTKFGSLLKEYASELKRYLPLSSAEEDYLKFEITDRTRDQIKGNAQLYISDRETSLPSQKYGAGSRSIVSLGMLTFIMRKRARGILALEEPETFLYPHAQRRVISESKKLATQIFVTTHSPFVLEQFSVDSLARIHRDASNNLKVTYLAEDANAKFYKRHLRKQIAEALLSRAVVITEEDSIAKWLRECSLLLDGQVRKPECLYEAFDLVGISVISADGNGGALPLARFIESAGIPVLICLDKTKSNTNFDQWIREDKPHFILDFKGLEDLLTAELSEDLIEEFCTKPQGIGDSKVVVDGLSELQKKKSFTEFLIRHKGSIPFQEWMISKITSTSIPQSFKSIIGIALDLLEGKMPAPVQAPPAPPPPPPQKVEAEGV